MGMKVGMQTGMSSNMSAAPSPVKQANFAAAPPQQQVVEGQSDMNAVQQVRRPLVSHHRLLLTYDTRCRQAVVVMISQCKADTGCSLTDIEQGLQGQFVNSNCLQLAKDVTEFLRSEGHVYPTIDDNHFQLCAS